MNGPVLGEVPMNEVDLEFRSLMDRVRSGDQEAAWELLEVYGPHILRVVRKKLNVRLRSKFDSVDFVQSVWASFFRQPSCVRRFDTPQDLVRFLIAVAQNKVTDETRKRFNTAKHDINKEEFLEDRVDAFDKRIEPIDARQSRPSEIAVAREEWHRLIKDKPRHHQQVMELRFQGATYQEIADSLHIHERTARKIVNELVGATSE